MNKLNSVFPVFFLLIAFLCLGACNKEEMVSKTFLINRHVEVILKDDICTGVKILKTFSNDKKCNTSEVHATLYICKLIDSKDTLYVLDLCEKAPDFAVDRDFKDNVCINKEDIKHYKAITAVKLSVPKNFKIPNKSKYIYAKPSQLND